MGAIARKAGGGEARAPMAPVPLTLAGSIQEVLEKERVAKQGKHLHDAMEDLYDHRHSRHCN